MNIAFRTDSSFKLGTGHIHRCLSLAREFKKEKVNCYFFSNDDPGNINNLVKREFALYNLSKIYSKDIFTLKKNYVDADLTIRLIKKLEVDLIFLDNYSIKRDWEKKVSKFCKIALISDVNNRKSFCDYYINYNLPYENKSLAKNLKKDCVKLLGPEYSIIKDLPNLNIKGKIKKKITIFMGGVDKKNYTSKLISILSNKLFAKFRKEIIVGQKNNKLVHLQKQTRKLKNFKITIGNKKSLYPFFINSKLVITSLGTSMYEHLTLGINSIVIAQNNIQKRIIKNISLYNLINFIDNYKNINKNYVYKVLNQKKFSKKKKELSNLFDRKGSSRIVNFFMTKNIFQNVELRKATTKDKYFLFKLINEPLVMKNSLTNKIVKFNEHNNWFNKVLKKRNSKIFIFQNLSHKLGQIQFDKVSTNKTYITYSVSSEFRGNNIGFEMINLALKKRICRTEAYAIVRKNDYASKKIFRKLGFKLVKIDQQKKFIYHLKNN